MATVCLLDFGSCFVFLGRVVFSIYLDLSLFLVVGDSSPFFWAWLV
jgi:hypothetical protein